MKIHEDINSIYVIPFDQKEFGHAIQTAIIIDKKGTWSRNSFLLDISFSGLSHLNEVNAKEYSDSILKAVEIVSKMKEKSITGNIFENGIISESEVYVKEDKS